MLLNVLSGLFNIQSIWESMEKKSIVDTILKKTHVSLSSS